MSDRERSLFKHKYLVRYKEDDEVKEMRFPTKKSAEWFCESMQELGKQTRITKE